MARYGRMESRFLPRFPEQIPAARAARHWTAHLSEGRGGWRERLAFGNLESAKSRSTLPVGERKIANDKICNADFASHGLRRVAGTTAAGSKTVRRRAIYTQG